MRKVLHEASLEPMSDSSANTKTIYLLREHFPHVREACVAINDRVNERRVEREAELCRDRTARAVEALNAEVADWDQAKELVARLEADHRQTRQALQTTGRWTKLLAKP